MDVQGWVSFAGFLTMSVLGAVHWKKVISGERDLYPRLSSSWPLSSRALRAYSRVFPIMVLWVWHMTAAIGVILAAMGGVLPVESRTAAAVGFLPTFMWFVLAAAVVLLNRPRFLVPRSKRSEVGLLALMRQGQ